MGEYNVTMGTLYEANQQIMSQLPPMEDYKISLKLADAGVWASAQKDFKYFMLLDRYRADYTVFNFESTNLHKFSTELKGLLQERGNILSIDFNNDADYYEMWVDIEGTANMFVLFPCNSFVITID